MGSIGRAGTQQTSRSTFVLEPRDYAVAAMMGKVEAVVHSHPQGGPASEWDQTVCSQGSVPVAHFEIPERMVDYQSLIGRQWEYGKADCFTLVRDWFKLQGIELPDYERPESTETCESIFLDQRQNGLALSR